MEPHEYLHIYRLKVQSLGYILPLIAFFSNFRDELQKTHHLYSRVQYDHSRSSKVIVFGGNRRGIWDFLLVINTNLGPILHRF